MSDALDARASPAVREGRGGSAMRWRHALPLLAFACLVLALWRGLRLDPHEVPSPLVGRPAPAFVSPRLDDPASSIRNTDLLGRVWVLTVWASWCDSCREEQAAVDLLARTGQVPVMGLDYKDTREQARAWLMRYGNPFRDTLFDPEGRVGLDYGVYGVPETFVIDRAGVVRLKLVGALDREAIDTRILPLLKALDG